MILKNFVPKELTTLFRNESILLRMIDLIKHDFRNNQDLDYSENSRESMILLLNNDFKNNRNLDYSESSSIKQNNNGF